MKLFLVSIKYGRWLVRAESGTQAEELARYGVHPAGDKFYESARAISGAITSIVLLVILLVHKNSELWGLAIPLTLVAIWMTFESVGRLVKALKPTSVALTAEEENATFYGAEKEPAVVTEIPEQDEPGIVWHTYG